ncbi:protein of unknown function [Aeromonas sp. RU39B]|jgi:hypothetical protein|uniref:DUF4224 domain-containing protein n=1 Tax=Aeromonas sp. RU39B TaxID=1907416 RepID=UPI000955F478|nr:protein of unknown function [Aeromonas sp. RU39B]
MNGIVISPEDIEALTGYKLPSKQCKALENAGIRFIKRPDGRPATTHDWISQAGNAKQIVIEDDGFNLEALGG